MSFVTKPALFLAAAAAIAFAPRAASAQEPKVRVTLGGGVTAGAIDSEPTLNLSAGYRFSNRFSFDVEVAGASAPADRFDIFPMIAGNVAMPSNVRVGSIMMGGRGGTLFPSGGIVLPGIENYRINNDGSTLLTTVGFRYNLPSSEARFRPYVSGGMGVSITEENFSMGLRADARNPNMPTTNLIDASTTHTGMALTGGVGASVRVFKQLSVGVDARYYRLDRGRNLGTFGGSVGYAF
ncbi:MAG: outer membrane beta-barrel protein [Vicinamibacterales bacterium]